MRKKAIRRIPVVDNGTPVGILSLGDLAIDRDPSSALGNIPNILLLGYMLGAEDAALALTDEERGWIAAHAPDVLLLFGEGTSSNGIHVLPFRTALVGSVFFSGGFRSSLVKRFGFLKRSSERRSFDSGVISSASGRCEGMSCTSDPPAATMMFGVGETCEHRVNHLETLRRMQEDNELRFQELEQRRSDASGSAPASAMMRKPAASDGRQHLRARRPRKASNHAATG